MRAEAGWCKTILLNTFSKSDRAALLSHRAAVRTCYSGMKSMSPKSTCIPTTAEKDLHRLECAKQRSCWCLLRKGDTGKNTMWRQSTDHSNEAAKPRRAEDGRPPSEARRTRQGSSRHTPEGTWSCHYRDYRLLASKTESEHWFCFYLF